MDIERLNEYWKEGKYMDLWSVNHVLSGVLAGAVLFSVGLTFKVALIISLVLFVAWEAFEIIFNIKEHMLNMTMDVVFDLLGFLLSSYIYLVLDKPFSLPVWILIIAFSTWFVYLGVAAAKKRKGSQTQVR